MYEMGQQEIDAVSAVLRSGQMFRYRGGENGEVDQVEKTMIRMMGCRYSLAVTSGTGALICGLVGLGIGPGDEVIVPAYTWLASAGAILSVGAIPVLAEVDETLTLDPVDFEARITPRTKAVIPVHMGGRPSDMDRIKAVADRHGVRILEDACQAIGGSYKGRRLASIGDAGAFSFNQFKIITCGEGGALLTSDRKIYERALYYHDMGCTFRGHAGDMAEEPFLGNTFRMNEVLGAILRIQFDRLDGILAMLRERRDWILDAVRAEKSPVRISPSADLAGDCGCHATFIFKSAQDRGRVAVRAGELNPACGLGTPLDSGLHVYTNWAVLLDQQGGHHPAMNPFRMPENKDCRLKITADSCPRTLEILARTGAIAINIGWTREQCQDIAKALCRAAKETL
jgi:dTDP-4-amino-4,6-dideoxygalactose transaminase